MPTIKLLARLAERTSAQEATVSMNQKAPPVPAVASAIDGTCCLEDLPIELLEKVARFADVQVKQALEQVNRTFRALLRDDVRPGIWNSIKVSLAKSASANGDLPTMVLLAEWFQRRITGIVNVRFNVEDCEAAMRASQKLKLGAVAVLNAMSPPVPSQICLPHLPQGLMSDHWTTWQSPYLDIRILSDSLTSLSGSCSMTIISLLPQLRQLRVLDLSEPTGAATLMWRLSGTLPTLEHLTLRGSGTCNVANRRSAFPSCVGVVAPALESLHLANFDHKILRLSGFLQSPTLERFTTLQHVAMTGCNLFGSSVPLQVLPRLDHLDLSGSLLGDMRSSVLERQLKGTMEGCVALRSLVLPRLPKDDPSLGCAMLQICVGALPALSLVQLSAGLDCHLRLFGGFETQFTALLMQAVVDADFGPRTLVLESSCNSSLSWVVT